jgi:hypothetical protein
VGNTYTASVYMNLVCLVALKAHELPGKRIFVYSFGSGALATAFQITARVPTSSSSRYTLQVRPPPPPLSFPDDLPPSSLSFSNHLPHPSSPPLLTKSPLCPPPLPLISESPTR